MNDTSRVAQRRYEALLRLRSPAERVAIAMSLSRAVRDLALAGVRAANPDATPHELRTKLAERLYGPDVARRLFGQNLR